MQEITWKAGRLEVIGYNIAEYREDISTPILYKMLDKNDVNYYNEHCSEWR